jgi:2-polyprenyl-3-methyl-5-hydroxy-6-metoxy-1,4-benzoquinol methylase
VHTATRVDEFSQAFLSLLQSVAAAKRAEIEQYALQQFPRYRSLYRRLQPHLPQGRVLDIGVYPGLFTGTLRRLGVDIDGVDLRPDQLPAEIAREVKMLGANVETDPLPCGPDSYDAVLLLAVIEHLRLNPLAVLREIRRVLKPRGRLLLQTPNLAYWGCRLSVLRGRSFDESPYSAYRNLETQGFTGHVRVYTMRELREIVEKSGFGVEREVFFNNDEWEPLKVTKSSLGNYVTGLFPSLRRQLFVVAVSTRDRRFNG